MRWYFALLFILLPLTALAGDMDFGNIEYTPHSGSMQAEISPVNASINCNNSQGYNCQPTGATGTYDITGREGSSVSISCSESASISSFGSPLVISNLKYYLASKLYQCQGLGYGTVNHIISANRTQNYISTGGRLQIPAGAKLSGDFSAINPGGIPHRFLFIYQ